MQIIFSQCHVSCIPLDLLFTLDHVYSKLVVLILLIALATVPSEAADTCRRCFLFIVAFDLDVTAYL